MKSTMQYSVGGNIIDVADDRRDEFLADYQKDYGEGEAPEEVYTFWVNGEPVQVKASRVAEFLADCEADGVEARRTRNFVMDNGEQLRLDDTAAENFVQARRSGMPMSRGLLKQTGIPEQYGRSAAEREALADLFAKLYPEDKGPDYQGEEYDVPRNLGDTVMDAARPIVENPAVQGFAEGLKRSVTDPAELYRETYGDGVITSALLGAHDFANTAVKGGMDVVAKAAGGQDTEVGRAIREAESALPTDQADMGTDGSVTDAVLNFANDFSKNTLSTLMKYAAPGVAAVDIAGSVVDNYYDAYNRAIENGANADKANALASASAGIGAAEGIWLAQSASGGVAQNAVKGALKRIFSMGGKMGTAAGARDIVEQGIEGADNPDLVRAGKEALKGAAEGAAFEATSMGVHGLADLGKGEKQKSEPKKPVVDEKARAEAKDRYERMLPEETRFNLEREIDEQIKAGSVPESEREAVTLRVLQEAGENIRSLDNADVRENAILKAVGERGEAIAKSEAQKAKEVGADEAAAKAEHEAREADIDAAFREFTEEPVAKPDGKGKMVKDKPKSTISEDKQKAVREDATMQDIMARAKNAKTDAEKSALQDEFNNRWHQMFDKPADTEAPKMDYAEAVKTLGGMDAALPERELRKKMAQWEEHADDPRAAKMAEAARAVLERRASQGKPKPTEDVEAKVESQKKDTNTIETNKKIPQLLGDEKNAERFKFGDDVIGFVRIYNPGVTTEKTRDVEGKFVGISSDGKAMIDCVKGGTIKVNPRTLKTPSERKEYNDFTKAQSHAIALRMNEGVIPKKEIDRLQEMTPEEIANAEIAFEKPVAKKPDGKGRMKPVAEEAKKPVEKEAPTPKKTLAVAAEPTDEGFKAWAVDSDGKPMEFASETERAQSRKLFDDLVRSGAVDGKTGANIDAEAKVTATTAKVERVKGRPRHLSTMTENANSSTLSVVKGRSEKGVLPDEVVVMPNGHGVKQQGRESEKSPCVIFKYKSDGAETVGHPLYGDVDAIAKWAEENGMTVKRPSERVPDGKGKMVAKDDDFSPENIKAIEDSAKEHASSFTMRMTQRQKANANKSLNAPVSAFGRNMKMSTFVEVAAKKGLNLSVEYAEKNGKPSAFSVVRMPDGSFVKLNETQLGYAQKVGLKNNEAEIESVRNKIAEKTTSIKRKSVLDAEEKDGVSVTENKDGTYDVDINGEKFKVEKSKNEGEYRIVDKNGDVVSVDEIDKDFGTDTFDVVHSLANSALKFTRGDESLISEHAERIVERKVSEYRSQIEDTVSREDLKAFDKISDGYKDALADYNYAKETGSEHVDAAEKEVKEYEFALKDFVRQAKTYYSLPRDKETGRPVWQISDTTPSQKLADPDFKAWAAKNGRVESDGARREYDAEQVDALGKHVTKNWIKGVKFKMTENAAEVPTGARMLYSRDGNVVGWYDSKAKEVVTLPGADASTVAHELGWHATYDHAKERAAAGDRALLDKLTKYAEDAKRIVTDTATGRTLEQDIAARYGRNGVTDPAVLLDEIGAARYTMEQVGKIKDAAARRQAAKWYERTWNAVADTYKSMLTKMGWNKARIDNLSALNAEQTVELLANEMLKGRNLGETEARGIDMNKGESVLGRYSRAMKDYLKPLEALDRDAGNSVSGGIHTKMRLVPGKVQAAINEAEAFQRKLGAKMKEAGVSVGELNEYMYAMAAGERNAKILRRNGSLDGSAMSHADIQRVLTAYQNSPKYAELERMRQEVLKFQKKGFDERVRAGLIDRQTAHDLEADEPNHVPMKSRFDADGNHTGFDSSATFGKPEWKKAEGRTNIGDGPLEWIMQEYVDAKSHSSVNDARQSLLATVLAHPEMGTVRRVRDGEALNEIRSPGQEGDPNVVTVKSNGATYKITLNGTRGETIARAITGRGVKRVNKGLQNAARWFSSTATEWSPTFAGRNFIADTIDVFAVNTAEKGIAGGAAANAKHVFNAVKLVPEIRKYVKTGETNDPVLREAIEAGVLMGGGIRSRAFQGDDYGIRTLKTDFAQGKNRAKALGKTMFGWVNTLNQTAEMMNRMADYKLQREAGKSKAEAALHAREVTVDFNQKGELTPWTNTAYMFSNSALGSTMRLNKALFASKHGWQLAAGTFALGLIEGFGEATMNGDDEDGKNVNEYTRANSIYIRNGKDIYRIPMHASPISLIKYAGNCAARKMMGTLGKSRWTNQVADDGIGILSQFAGVGNVGDNKIAGIAPTLIQPFVQAVQNRDFADRPIEKTTYSENQPKSHNGRTNTPELYKEIAKALNAAGGGNEARRGSVNVLGKDISTDISPEMIKHFAEAIGKNTLRDVENVENMLEVAFGKAEADRRNVPGVRDYYRTAGENDDRFFKAYGKYKADADELKNRTKWESGEKADYIKERPWLYKTGSTRTIDRWVSGYSVNGQHVIGINDLRKMEQGMIRTKSGKFVPHEWTKEKIEEFKKRRLELQAKVIEKMGG